jgi:hypothetical protein
LFQNTSTVHIAEPRPSGPNVALYTHGGGGRGAVCVVSALPASPALALPPAPLTIVLWLAMVLVVLVRVLLLLYTSVVQLRRPCVKLLLGGPSSPTCSGIVDVNISGM